MSQDVTGPGKEHLAHRWRGLRRPGAVQRSKASPDAGRKLHYFTERTTFATFGQRAHSDRVEMGGIKCDEAHVYLETLESAGLGPLEPFGGGEGAGFPSAMAFMEGVHSTVSVNPG